MALPSLAATSTGSLHSSQLRFSCGHKSPAPSLSSRAGGNDDGLDCLGVSVRSLVSSARPRDAGRCDHEAKSIQIFAIFGLEVQNFAEYETLSEGTQDTV